MWQLKNLVVEGIEDGLKLKLRKQKKKKVQLDFRNGSWNELLEEKLGPKCYLTGRTGSPERGHQGALED